MRNLIVLNKATLFKQAWRIQNNPKLIVSQIFRAKYSDIGFDNSLRGKIPRSSSWGGRSIMRIVEFMSPGVGKIVGNGKLQMSWTQFGWEVSRQF